MFLLAIATAACTGCDRRRSSREAVDAASEKPPVPEPEPVKSGFSLDSRPSAARVYVDGRLLPWRTPMRITDLDPGTHRIRLEYQGYLPWQTQIHVVTGVVLALPEARLTPELSPDAPGQPSAAPWVGEGDPTDLLVTLVQGGDGGGYLRVALRGDGLVEAEREGNVQWSCGYRGPADAARWFAKPETLNRFLRVRDKLDRMRMADAAWTSVSIRAFGRVEKVSVPRLQPGFLSDLVARIRNAASGALVWDIPGNGVAPELVAVGAAMGRCLQEPSSIAGIAFSVNATDGRAYDVQLRTTDHPPGEQRCLRDAVLGVSFDRAIGPPTCNPWYAFATGKSYGSFVPVPMPVPENAIRTPGYLRINTRPPTRVIIDGEPVGTTPLSDIELPAGRHKLELKNELQGIERLEYVNIKPGETYTRVFTLTAD